MHEYSKVQFVGYAIHTNPKADYTAQSFTDWWFKKQTYLGSDVEADDVKNRLAIMQAAMEKAYGSSDVVKTADTLKIFVAPEFYFRGKQGAYEFPALDAAVSGLQALAKPAKWEHWLFFFGSILAWFEETDGTLKVVNACLVQPGGKGMEASRIVQKEFKSTIDFTQRHQWLVRGAEKKPSGMKNDPTQLHDQDVSHLPAGAKGRGKEWSKQHFDGLGMFVHEGITFGVEVCLDHLKKRLRQSPPGRGRTGVQIQVITSAGMDVKAPAVVALKDGYAFNVDGSNPIKPGNPAHSQLKKVTTACAGGTDATLGADIDYKPIALTADTTVNTHFARGAGEIHVYAAVPTPKASIVL